MKSNPSHGVPQLARVVLGLAIFCSLFAPLLGHVAVFPQTTEAGTRHASFYLRAPVEKDIPVVELGFEVDEQWIANGGSLDFEDIPDWELHVEMDEDERIERVYWTAMDEGALPMTFQMIFMRVNVPKDTRRISFRLLAEIHGWECVVVERGARGGGQ